MGTPLLGLGPHIFEIAPLNFQQIERSTGRYGRRSAVLVGVQVASSPATVTIG